MLHLALSDRCYMLEWVRLSQEVSRCLQLQHGGHQIQHAPLTSKVTCTVCAALPDKVLSLLCHDQNMSFTQSSLVDKCIWHIVTAHHQNDRPLSQQTHAHGWLTSALVETGRVMRFMPSHICNISCLAALASSLMRASSSCRAQCLLSMILAKATQMYQSCV